MSNDNLQNFIRDHREEFDGETPPAGLWDRIETSIRETPPVADPLETFIANHRDAFDDKAPPPRVAELLFAPAPAPKLRTSHRRKRTFTYLLGIAASVLLVIGAYTFGNHAGYQAGQEQRVAQELEKIDPQLAETERFFQQKIASEFVKVNQVNDDPQLRRDLKAIDEATEQIRAQLLEVPVSQRATLVNQLIETYRTKLDILLRIQQRLPNSPGKRGKMPLSNQATNEI